jgi:hypothetical protein
LSGRRGGITGVRTSDLFWRTLEPHRIQSHYQTLRNKIAELIQRKRESTGPASGRDSPFGSNNALLAGIWHYKALRNPDVVVFYVIEKGALCLAMVGSHDDYPFNGKNLSASARTGTRIRNAVAAGDSGSPMWPALSWGDPSEIPGHPELDELSAPALDRLAIELLEEMEDGPRYVTRNGRRVEDGPEEEFERYFADLSAAADAVRSARALRHGRYARTEGASAAPAWR